MDEGYGLEEDEEGEEEYSEEAVAFGAIDEEEPQKESKPTTLLE